MKTLYVNIPMLNLVTCNILEILEFKLVQEFFRKSISSLCMHLIVYFSILIFVSNENIYVDRTKDERRSIKHLILNFTEQIYT